MSNDDVNVKNAETLKNNLYRQFFEQGIPAEVGLTAVLCVFLETSVLLGFTKSEIMEIVEKSYEETKNKYATFTSSSEP